MNEEESLSYTEDLRTALITVPSIVVSSPFLINTEQVRFPKSKRARIRKKWAKRSENFRRIADEKIYRVGSQFIMHPSTMVALKNELKRQGISEPMMG